MAFAHSRHPQVFAEHQLCARHHSSHLECGREHNQVPVLMELANILARTDNMELPTEAPWVI